ncbi:unnamed protein product, partial [Closterium sp. NIES-54]
MASLRVLAFDHDGIPVQFDTWLDDLQLYLLSDSRDSWLTRDAAARLAIRNHLPLAECAHFRQHRTAQALYDAVVARYSSPATAALGRLLLPYLFPELSAFATVEDLVSHLRASDTRYRAAAPSEFLDKNQPPMFIGGGGGGGGSGGSGGGTGGGSGGSGGGGGGSGGSGGCGGSGTGGGGSSTQRVGSGGGQCQQQQRGSETQSPQQLREWFLRGASGGSCP